MAVLFGNDNPDRTDGEVTQRCREFLAKHLPEYTDARVEVLRQNQLAGLLEQYPALAKEPGRLNNLRFQDHHSWKQQEDMSPSLSLGVQQVKFIETLQRELRQSDVAVNVRVSGEPGSGKTRLVLEAVTAEDLSPLVVYYNSEREFLEDGLLGELESSELDITAVLVIDDCSGVARIWVFVYHPETPLKSSLLKISLLKISLDKRSGFGYRRVG